MLYTDVDAAAEAPPNVTVKPTTVPELNRRCSDLLGIHIDIQRRKLCDLKIAYGVVFADDLSAFDFWGCSDLDIIWGDLRRFATDARLHAHDIFSSRRDKLSGHCTLYRNIAAVNELFTRIPNVMDLLASSHYEHLDERELTKQVRSSPRVYWAEELATNAAYQKALGERDLWWRNGRTFGPEGDELMYIHFHKLKQDMKGMDFDTRNAPAAFRINRAGIFAA